MSIYDELRDPFIDILAEHQSAVRATTPRRSYPMPPPSLWTRLRALWLAYWRGTPLK